MEQTCMQIVYTEKALIKLFAVRNELLHPVRKRAIQLAAVGLIAYSLFVLPRSVVSLAVLFVGCIVITNAGSSAKQEARAAAQMLGVPRCVEYHFLEEHFIARCAGETTEVKYSEIAYFLMDAVYFYLFTPDGTGYLVDKASAPPEKSKGILTVLQERLGKRCWPVGCAAIWAIARRIKQVYRKHM